MNKHRRVFLKTGLAASLVCTSGRLYAAPVAGPRLLVVFLRGGYDSNSFLVPYASSDYYEARPTIAVAKPDPNSNTGALALDADWALAPAVRGSLGALYAQRQAVFVPFAGSDDLSRSHFETQDSIEMGQGTGSVRNFRSGFLGRLSESLVGAGARMSSIAFTDALPLAFEGSVTVPNVSLRNVAKPAFDERQAGIIDDMYAGHRLRAAVSSGLELRHEVAADIVDGVNAANRNAISTKGFELEAQGMGTLMQEKFRVGFIDVGGWDTHVDQGAAQGRLAADLASVGSGIRIFSESLGTEWRNTVVVVLSEFGRTFRENGSRGTDHGHGTVYWVLGGAVNGGAVRGAQQRVARNTLFQDRDFPVLNDYRAVLGGLFRSMWALSPRQSEHVFPQVRPESLNLV